MPERLKKRSMRVVGVRQVLRGLKENKLDCVFLSLDAAPHLRQQVEQAARETGTALSTVATMEELSQLCRVDVPSAAACSRTSVPPFTTAEVAFVQKHFPANIVTRPFTTWSVPVVLQSAHSQKFVPFSIERPAAPVNFTRFVATPAYPPLFCRN